MDNNNGFNEWGGYMAAKITKLEEQFSAARDYVRQTNLFSGISIFVNGLTNPSADELKQIMMIHGGTFHHYERPHTTYIIASNLPDVKVRKMNVSNIISPQWILDCVQENRIIDYTRYLLYTNQKASQPGITFINNSFFPACNKGESKSIELKSRENKETLEQFTLPSTTCENMSNNVVDSLPIVKPNVDQKMKSAKDPNFISEFYNKSRLHHISTLSSTFKQYINDLREKHVQCDIFPARKSLAKSLLSHKLHTRTSENVTQNIIMHIDMDCFFVSVGLRSHPHLRGFPVAVTHSKGGVKEIPIQPGADRRIEMELLTKRFDECNHDNKLSNKVRNAFSTNMSLSEIASCSYEARAKGIKNGMFVGEALKLCPDLKTIQYDFDGYKEVAYTLYNTIAQYTLDIEAVSCDEMFVDLSSVINELNIEPMDFVRVIRDEVRQRTGCPCSAGVGSNKLQARMATKRAKPDGQYHLISTDVKSYMANITIKDLPGVGSSTTYVLNEANLITCGDLQKVSLEKIQMYVGKKFGETLYQFCRGVDNRHLVYEQVRKSVSAEVNYGIRFTEYNEVEKFLRQLCTEVHTRLCDIKRKTKNVTLKLMIRSKDAPKEASKFMGHGVCDHITKSATLSDFTNDLDIITHSVLSTMKALTAEPTNLRGIGIQLSKLNHPNDIKQGEDNRLKNMFKQIIIKQKDKPRVSNERNDVSRIETIVNDTVLSNKCKNVSNLKRANDIIGSINNVTDEKRIKFNKHYSSETIDPDVFAALPNTIKSEVLNNLYYASNVHSYSRHGNKHIDLPSTSKAVMIKHLKIKKYDESDQEVLTALDELSTLNTSLCKTNAKISQFLLNDLDQKQNANSWWLREALEEQRKPAHIKCDFVGFDENAYIAPNNIFNNANFLQLLLTWIHNCSAPENYDIYLLSEHARELVRKLDINRLYEFLVYICRLLNSRLKIITTDCSWHAAYKYIINAVQNEMLAIYGSKLFLHDQLQCTICN